MGRCCNAVANTFDCRPGDHVRKSLSTWGCIHLPGLPCQPIIKWAPETCLKSKEDWLFIDNITHYMLIGPEMLLAP